MRTSAFQECRSPQSVEQFWGWLCRTNTCSSGLQVSASNPLGADTTHLGSCAQDEHADESVDPED